MPSKFNLNEKEIIKMYEEGMTSIQIAEMCGVSKPTILRRLHKNGISLRPNAYERKYGLDENAFLGFTPEICYWVGFIAADGNIYKNRLSIELNSIDEKHLLKLKLFLKTDINLYYRKRKTKSGKLKEYCCLQVNSEKIVNSLKNNFNLVPAKSLVLEPPNIPQKYIKDFIKGYFDGDGCIGFDKYLKLTFTGGSYKFLQWIKKNIENSVKTGDPKICTKNKSCKDYYLSYHGTQVLKIMNWLYENCDNNFLCRKKIKYEGFIGGLK